MINNGNRIVGSFGHATAIFRRPIIEGQFFLEIMVREDAKKDKKVTNASAVRVGICNSTFNPSFPLGYGESVAYKSNGSVLHQGEKTQKWDSFKVGDKIAILLKVRAPSKYPNSE